MNNQSLTNIKAITVLDDGETWSDLINSKVILLSNNFEYNMIDSASDFYDKSLTLNDGSSMSQLIVEELSISQLVEFYLKNRK